MGIWCPIQIMLHISGSSFETLTNNEIGRLNQSYSCGQNLNSNFHEWDQNRMNYSALLCLVSSGFPPSQSNRWKWSQFPIFRDQTQVISIYLQRPTGCRIFSPVSKCSSRFWMQNYTPSKFPPTIYSVQVFFILLNHLPNTLDYEDE